ncbi:MAG: outer membrane protein assembly factor BamD, partial [Kiritimatiellae bacterium]|nr:outer membrane protein assembly factor BamD [Kiritimatiellia bacterium]
FALCAAGAGLYAATPGPGTHYATDAYPGFDSESNVLSQERKTPSFLWWRKAKFENPQDQLKLARGYVSNDSYGFAENAYNALVATFPFSPEAVAAQEELADLYLYKIKDPISALEEYKYLVDFYSSNCDYDKVMMKMYETAKKMREDGKRIVFFRFANTTDVRQAFEAVVRRAPGAVFAPEAMYAIVELRVEDEEFSAAIDVCKTIRNRYSASPEAKAALFKEAELRMILLKEHEYNRDRSLNTVSFMAMAARTTDDNDAREKFLKWRDEASAIVEKEAYEAARFYDSRTRKLRGAINAYEGFLRDYPASPYAQAVRERLEELKSPTSVKE